jgi:hypothetical protein
LKDELHEPHAGGTVVDVEDGALRAGGVRPWPAPAREAHVEHGEEPLKVEGLQEIGLHAGGEHLGGEIRVRLAAEDDHRRLPQLRVSAKGAQHRRSLHVREMQIQEDHIGSVLTGHGESELSEVG